ncbi:MAG: cell division protease FtsH [Patescibacteria group bacterium]|nr:cell division protease FtsH [Patescibacteria group bacterium]
MEKKQKKSGFIEFLKNWWLSIILLMLFISYPYLVGDKKDSNQISVSEVAQLLNQGKVDEIKIKGQNLSIISGTTTYKSQKEPEANTVDTLKNLGASSTILSNTKITIEDESGLKYLLNYAGLILPIIFFGFMIWMLLRGVKNANVGAISFGNTRAKKIMPDDKNQRVTFDDVAGAKVAKQELKEIVEFLKSPQKFIDIGAVIPKGVLLTGAPGTGKTLLARAVAGEAGVPFFHLSGSEFIEMFVGVGASRVRDLFNEAKKSAPAIIFIDEIDSIGRSRGIGTGGGNDEREQTLNQILVEMDGFEPTQKVIVMAATNRSDVLDQALLRPGRFDRRIVIDLPDRNERKDILEVHSKNKKIGVDVDREIIATRTPGFSGAELQSLMNESAILAAQEGRKEVSQWDIIRSIEKVMLGPERKNHLMGEEEKRLVAYHEAGHALVAAVLPNADPVHKISIISRGNAGGYTLKLPTDERRLTNKKVFMDDIAMTFGGYAAEELVSGTTSTGPSSDIEQATAMARAMVTRYGMSDTVGPISIESDKNSILYGRSGGDKVYSNEFSKMVDEEIKRIVEEGRDRARKIVNEYRKVLDNIANELIEKENLEREDFENILKANGIEPKK